MRTWMAVLFSFTAFTLAACGDDGTNGDPTRSDAADTAVSSDTTEQDTTLADISPRDTQNAETTGSDTSTPPDLSPPDTADHADALPPGCDHAGYEAADGAATLSPTRLSVDAVSSATEPNHGLYLRTYQTPDLAVGSVLGFSDVPLEDCTVCLVIQTGCGPDTCERNFLAIGGTAEIVRADTQLELELAGVEMVEVSFDADMNSTVVSGGAGYCMDDPSVVSVPLTFDPCGDWTNPLLADDNCEVANSFTVQFDGTGVASNFETVYAVTWDFGDGVGDWDTLTTQHTYAPGEYEVSLEIVGLVAGYEMTLTVPDRIRVVAP